MAPRREWQLRRAETDPDTTQENLTGRNRFRAPRGDLLAERIVAEQARNDVPQRRRAWPAWTLPLATAGAVAAVVASVLGVSHIREAAPTPAVSRGGVVAPAPTAHPTARPTLHATSQPSGHAVATGSRSSSSSSTRPAPPPRGSPAAPGFAGRLLGHWVTRGGRTIWTTEDGGASWSGFSYS